MSMRKNKREGFQRNECSCRRKPTSTIWQSLQLFIYHTDMDVTGYVHPICENTDTQSSNADSMPARSPSRSICTKIMVQPRNTHANPPVDFSSFRDDAKPVSNDQRYHTRAGLSQQLA